jgi:hypothetical protein
MNSLQMFLKEEWDYVRLGIFVKFGVESEIVINQNKCVEMQEPDDIRFL